MEPTADEIAGVVDIFGALSRDRLGEALAELAYKRGGEYDPDGFGPAIDAAVESYHLVAVETDGVELLVAGPVAFPELPEGAADLPHILDVPERTVDSERVARAAERRFREEAASAVTANDQKRIEALLDASYELEAWGGVDLAAVRERLLDGR